MCVFCVIYLEGHPMRGFVFEHYKLENGTGRFGCFVDLMI